MSILNFNMFLTERLNIDISDLKNDLIHSKNFDEFYTVLNNYKVKINLEIDNITPISEWLFPTIGITIFSISDNIITIHHSIMFKSLLNKCVKNTNKWIQFINDFTRSIGHELIHISQYEKIHKNVPTYNISTHPDYEKDRKGYFGNIHEIEAHAWEIYTSLALKMTNEEIIKFIQNISTVKLTVIKKYSEELFKYYAYRDDKKIWNKLLQYILNYCN